MRKSIPILSLLALCSCMTPVEKMASINAACYSKGYEEISNEFQNCVANKVEQHDKKQRALQNLSHFLGAVGEAQGKVAAQQREFYEKERQNALYNAQMKYYRAGSAPRSLNCTTSYLGDNLRTSCH